MPFLIPAIIAAVASIITAIVDAVGKKTLVAAVLIAALMGMYALFAGAMEQAILILDLLSMPTWLVTGISMLPTNTDDCLQALGTSYMARLVFDSGREALGIRAAA